MKNILLSVVTIVMLISADMSAASTHEFLAVPEHKTYQTTDQGEVQLAQRGFGWGRRNFNRGFQRQQQQRRMQQQRLQQQRLQRQRMEQQRRQQAQQRQRMMEQRRRQQQAMRARQQQMALQRQRMAEQRRLAQTRQRQEAQRRQGQQRQTAQNRALQAQRAARQRLQNQQRLRRLRQLQERNRKIQVQKQQQKQRELAMLTSLRTTRSVATLKSPVFKKRIQETRVNLQKVKNHQAKLNKKSANALNTKAQNTAKVAALKSKLVCDIKTKSCGCSFHGSTLVKTLRGMVPIKDIEVWRDYAWSKNEFTGEQDWKKITDHFVNTYDQRVVVRVQDSNGRIQEIISNEFHPFFVQIPEDRLSVHLASSVSSMPPLSSEGYYYTGSIEDGQWIDALNLKPGFRLLDANGKWSEVTYVEHRVEKLKAYNLTVREFHTYFVASNGNAKPIWVHNNCNSRIKESPLLVREAQKAGRNSKVQKDIDRLTAKLKQGNENPGIGTKAIGNGILEARGRNGGRVYYRKINNNIEILGKSGKANQETVIKEIKKTF